MKIGGQVVYVVDTTRPVKNAWYFLALTYSGSELALWDNGHKTAAVAASGAINVTSFPLRMSHGGWESPSPRRWFGTIDDARIYNQALSTTELDSLYHLGGWPINTSPTVTDIDGNVYHTVTIGTQVWMAENLKTTRLKDGTVIPLVTDGTAWGVLTTPGYCWYNDSAAYKNPYGALYNWYAVNTGKLAPTGWHVATDSEWTVLSSFLGGDSAAGGKLKETGVTHWNSPNIGATNETGFSALPGGSRSTGAYGSIGLVGDWWSSTPGSGQNSWFRSMAYNNTVVTYPARPWFYGFSVRCVKDP